MKRIISILICLTLPVCFASCNSSEGNGDKVGTSPVVTLYADKKAVAPGDEIVISVNVCDALHSACFDISVLNDAELQYISMERGKDIGEYYVEGNELTVDGVKAVHIGAFIMTAYTLDNDDVATITYKVPEDAKIGENIKFTLNCDSFDLGKDESGDELYSVLENVSLKDVRVRIAEESVAADKRDNEKTAAENTTAEETTAEETTLEETTFEETTLDETASDEALTDELLSASDEAADVASEETLPQEEADVPVPVE